jgi:hypothetical protein
MLTTFARSASLTFASASPMSDLFIVKDGADYLEFGYDD